MSVYKYTVGRPTFRTNVLVLLCILSKMVFCSRSSDSFLIFSLVYLALTLGSQTPFVVHIDLIALIKGLIGLCLIAYILPF